MTLGEALEKAGLSRQYLKAPPDRERSEGRSTNAVLNLAEVLDQSPAELLGIPDLTPKLEEALRHWREVEGQLPSAVDSGDDDLGNRRLQRITITARIIAGQLATLIYCASDRADTDPAILLGMIMHEVNNHAHNSKPDQSGGDPKSRKKRGSTRSSKLVVNQPPPSQ
jgi:hypothetical protein